MREVRWPLQLAIAAESGTYRKTVGVVIPDTFDQRPEEFLNVTLAPVEEIVIETTFARDYLDTLEDTTGQSIEAYHISPEFGSRRVACREQRAPDGSLSMSWRTSPGVRGDMFRLQWRRPALPPE